MTYWIIHWENVGSEFGNLYVFSLIKITCLHTSQSLPVSCTFYNDLFGRLQGSVNISHNERVTADLKRAYCDRAIP